MNAAAPPLALVELLEDGHVGVSSPLTGPTFSIGRAPTSDLWLSDDRSISRKHCVIHAIGSFLMIEDRSRNGTFVNGQKLDGVQPLALPALIVIGSHQVTIRPSRSDGRDRISIGSSENITPPEIVVPRTEGRYQAFLVVDTIDTGDTDAHSAALGRVTLALGRRLEKSVADESEEYLRRTANGFLACFSSVDRALAAGLRLAPAVARYLPPTSQLSVALHWGTARLTDTGDRVGDDVRAALALGQIRHDQPGLFADPELQQTSEVVLMTEAFYAKLTRRLQPMASVVGPFVLEGLAQPAMVHLVSWKSVVASRKASSSASPRPAST